MLGSNSLNGQHFWVKNLSFYFLIEFLIKIVYRGPSADYFFNNWILILKWKFFLEWHLIFCKLCITEMIKIFISAQCNDPPVGARSHVPSCHKQATVHVIHCGVATQFPATLVQSVPTLGSRPDMASKPKNLNIKIRFRDSASSFRLTCTYHNCGALLPRLGWIWSSRA